MDSGIVQAFYGQGRGKTSAAVGQALREAGDGQHITVIQFLKGKAADEFRVLARLEPDVQFFRFDQSDSSYCDLSLQEKEEEKQNIRNAFNFAKKVIETGESDVIILDELLDWRILVLSRQGILRNCSGCPVITRDFTLQGIRWRTNWFRILM